MPFLNKGINIKIEKKEGIETYKSPMFGECIVTSELTQEVLIAQSERFSSIEYGKIHEDFTDTKTHTRTRIGVVSKAPTLSPQQIDVGQITNDIRDRLTCGNNTDVSEIKNLQVAKIETITTRCENPGTSLTGNMPCGQLTSLAGWHDIEEAKVAKNANSVYSMGTVPTYCVLVTIERNPDSTPGSRPEVLYLMYNLDNKFEHACCITDNRSARELLEHILEQLELISQRGVPSASQQQGASVMKPETVEQHGSTSLTTGIRS